MDIQYVECGKIFLTSERGALEYSFLDRSDNNLATKIVNDFYLSKVANFVLRLDLTTEDNKSPSPVAVALISWNTTTYLFMQVQQRTENEFIHKSLSSYTKRAFNQARFTFINKKDFEYFLQNHIGMAASLLYDNPKDPGKNKLKDYIFPQQGQVQPVSIQEKSVFSISAPHKNELLKEIVNVLYSRSQPNKDTTTEILPRIAHPVFVLNHRLSLSEKLRHLDWVQYWIFPALGSITYTSDYVTDRTSVLNFRNDLASINQNLANSVIDRNNPGELQAENYFDAVSSLSPTELYHPTLFYYLRSPLHPKVAVTIFRSIETDSNIEDEVILNILETQIDYMRNDDLKKIIEKRFNNYDRLLKLKSLLSKIPIGKRKNFLFLILDKTQKDLARFYPFYLEAITGVEPQSSDAYKLREPLKESILSSTESILDSVQQNNKEILYQELILSGYRLPDKGVISPDVRRICFASDHNTDIDTKTVLECLMERKEEGFFKAIEALFSSDIGKSLLTQISSALEKGRFKWNLSTIYRLWQLAPIKTRELFVVLLRYLLSGPASSLETLDEAPLIFRDLLMAGRDNLSKRSKENQLQKGGNQYHGLAESLYSDEHLLKNLRKASLIVARPNSIDNITFGYWWLIEELVYTENDVLFEDYSSLIQSYKYAVASNLSKVSPEALFILSGGKLGKGLSIQKCLSSYDYIKQPYLGSTFYTNLLKIWLKLECSIPSHDIAGLVEKLPDSIALELLRDVVLSKNKAQLAEILELDAQVATDWLRKTKHSRVIDDSGEDLLYSILLDLKRTTSEFIRYMLLSEPSSKNSVSSWKEYSAKISSIYSQRWSSSIHDSFIEHYMQLTSALDCHFDLNKYQPLLIEIVRLNSPRPDQAAIAKQQSITLLTIIDFIFENKVYDDVLAEQIAELIKQRFTNGEIIQVTSKLSFEKIQAFRNLVLKSHNVWQDEIGSFIEAEYQGQYDKQLASTFSKHQPKPSKYDEPETKPRKENKAVNTAMGANQNYGFSKSSPNYSSLELILTGILLFILLIIILLILNEVNDVIYKEIFRFITGNK